jgi:hypothetical protein
MCFPDLNLKATFGPGATFFGFLIQEPQVLRLVLWFKTRFSSIHFVEQKESNYSTNRHTS